MSWGRELEKNSVGPNMTICMQKIGEKNLYKVRVLRNVCKSDGKLSWVQELSRIMKI